MLLYTKKYSIKFTIKKLTAVFAMFKVVQDGMVLVYFTTFNHIYVYLKLQSVTFGTLAVNKQNCVR